MRPLVVLLLVLGSLAALLFALVTFTDTERASERGGGIAVTPAPGVEPSPELVPAQPVVEGVGAARLEPTRQVLQPDLDSGRRVAFGAIEGVVVSNTGEPIRGARVGLLNSKPSALGDDIYALRGVDPPKAIAKLETGQDGAFRFDQLDPRKDWSLTISHDSYASFQTELAIAVPEGGTWQENIVLEPGMVSQGVVRDARNNQPIAGARLAIDGPFARMNRNNSPGRLESITDQDGAYVFSNVAASPQARVLTITAPGYATQVHTNFTMVVQGEAPIKFKNARPKAKLEARNHDFLLEPGLVVAGRVVNPERRGVAGVEIEAISQSGTLISQGIALSTAKGEFLIEGLAEGIYTLRVTAAGFDAHPVQRVEAGMTDVLIELFELGSVTGKVVDSGGRPLTNFTVKARAGNEVSKALGSVVAQRVYKGSKDGSFELRGLAEGEYVVEGLAEGHASCFSDTFTATQGLVTSDIVVRMTQGGSISGFVLESYATAPVVGAEVETMDNDWAEDGIFELFGALEEYATTKTKVFTDAEGRFEIPRVTPGIYQVQVRAKGFSPYSVKDVVVVEGQDTPVPAYVLIKGATISGTVYGPDKRVQSGASVQMSASDQSAFGHRRVRVDGKGRYRIENVKPGTYEISATRPSSGSGNPFEAISDMNNTKIEVSVEDGRDYEFDLRFKPASPF